MFFFVRKEIKGNFFKNKRTPTVAVKKSWKKIVALWKMAAKIDDKSSEIPERLYDTSNNKSYKRMRFFGKVSQHWIWPGPTHNKFLHSCIFAQKLCSPFCCIRRNRDVLRDCFAVKLFFMLLTWFFCYVPVKNWIKLLNMQIILVVCRWVLFI